MFNSASIRPLRLFTAIAATLLVLRTPAQARPLDEAIDNAIQQWSAPRTHQISERHVQCDWDRIASVVTEPISFSRDDHCTIAAKKGHQLLCMMVNPNTEQTVYQQNRELAFYGYVTQITPNDENPGLSNAVPAMRQIGISDDEHRWIYVNQGHVRSTPGYPRTLAFFQNHVNPTQGAVIAFNNKGPVQMNHDTLTDQIEAPDEVVPLRQWSDVFFLGWREACRAAPGGLANIRRLEHVFRENIINQDTVEVLRSVIGKDWLTEDDAWPGFEYDITNVKMKAVIGTPNGNGIAWLVGQHHGEIGLKFIDRVNIFNGGTTYAPSWCLYFHLRSYA